MPWSRINILMVDDQPGKLLTYESMLDADWARTLIKAQTAREALAHLLKEDIAVVLMDVNMPELDGFELAAMIRQHPRCQRTAIIFVSAVHLSDLDRVKGYATGAVDYVSVPVVPEILRAKVGVFVDLYRKTTRARAPQPHAGGTRRRAHGRARADDRASCASASSACASQGDALAEADRRKTEFLAMLAHELRNPLQPIRTSVELLREPGRTPEQLQWARDVIDRQVEPARAARRRPARRGPHQQRQARAAHEPDRPRADDRRRGRVESPDRRRASASAST